MLHTAEIQQRFKSIQQVVNQAEQVCQSDQSVPLLRGRSPVRIGPGSPFRPGVRSPEPGMG